MHAECNHTSNASRLSVWVQRMGTRIGSGIGPFGWCCRKRTRLLGRFGVLQTFLDRSHCRECTNDKLNPRQGDAWHHAKRDGDRGDRVSNNARTTTYPTFHISPACKSFAPGNLERRMQFADTSFAQALYHTMAAWTHAIGSAWVDTGRRT